MRHASSTTPSNPRSAPPRPSREKPDARPARLMMGAGALAATTVIAAGLVDFPPAAAESMPPAPNVPDAVSVEQAERPARYIKLKRGQKAPKGAKVIQAAAPTPRVVVREVPVSVQQRQPQPVARTKQSGS